MSEKPTYEQLEQQIDSLRFELTALKSDQRQIQDSLKDSETELEAIYLNAPVILLLLDADRRIAKSNRLATNFAGRTNDELIGVRGGEALRCLNALDDARGCGFGPECAQCTLRRCVLDTLATGRGHHQIEASLPFKLQGQGQKITFLLSTTPLKIREQSMVLVSILDITQRKQAEEALRQSQERFNQAQKMEAIGTLAGGIAHDFNNILFPLLGFAEMLKEDLAVDSPLQDKVDEILHAAIRSRELVQQILAFSRKAEHKARPIRIQFIVREALKLLRAAIPATIGVTQNIAPDCGPVMADPSQIHQIVMNLATNAFHAMEESGGALTVTLREVEVTAHNAGVAGCHPGRYALLSIADTGIGMSRQVLDKAFDPYFTTKTDGKGTGLGLAVVQGLVKSHGGEIQIQSAPGKGTACHIYLPIVFVAVGQEIANEKEPIPGGTEKILLVDDEEAIVRMLGSMLTRLGYLVTSHTSSAEALERFKAEPSRFDLVLTDMTMPEITGIKLAREVKIIRPQTPVIICTGFCEKLDAAGCKALGMQGYLPKPVSTREVAETVRGVWDKR